MHATPKRHSVACTVEAEISEAAIFRSLSAGSAEKPFHDDNNSALTSIVCLVIDCWMFLVIFQQFCKIVKTDGSLYSRLSCREVEQAAEVAVGLYVPDGHLRMKHVSYAVAYLIFF